MRSIAKKPFPLKGATATLARSGEVLASPIEPQSPRRQEAERFIRRTFRQHHGAFVQTLTPHILALEQGHRFIAAAGWRGADEAPLFLERYLDGPVERMLERVCGQPVQRRQIAEVGHLASERPGGSLLVTRFLAQQLHRQGYAWAVFTATRELIGIFTRLGLPLLALASADAARLGEEARLWGRYYETEPVVVAGRIRLALAKRFSG